MNLLAPINRLFYNSNNIQITGAKQAMIALFLQVGIERWRNYRDMFLDCYCRSSPYWANLNENLYRDSELVLRVKSNGSQYKGIIDNRTNLIEIFSLPKENTLYINNDIPVFNWAARYTASKSELSALVFYIRLQLMYLLLTMNMIISILPWKELLTSASLIILFLSKKNLQGLSTP